MPVCRRKTPRQAPEIGVKRRQYKTLQMLGFSMMNFAQARKNMVDCQIATMGIVDPVLLSVLNRIPRERFVPEDRQALAYTDEDLKLDRGRFLMEPLVLARLVQAAAIKPEDRVLAVGDSTGYAAAVLSCLAGAVVCPFLPAAESVWRDSGCGNIIQAGADAVKGCPDHEPYNVVFVAGSVPALPQVLLDQMRLDGRLLTVLRAPGAPVGKAVIVTKNGNAGHSSRILMDATTPFVPEFVTRSAFVF